MSQSHSDAMHSACYVLLKNFDEVALTFEQFHDYDANMLDDLNKVNDALMVGSCSQDDLDAFQLQLREFDVLKMVRRQMKKAIYREFRIKLDSSGRWRRRVKTRRGESIMDHGLFSLDEVKKYQELVAGYLARGGHDESKIRRFLEGLYFPVAPVSPVCLVSFLTNQNEDAYLICDRQHAEVLLTIAYEDLRGRRLEFAFTSSEYRALPTEMTWDSCDDYEDETGRLHPGGDFEVEIPIMCSYDSFARERRKCFSKMLKELRLREEERRKFKEEYGYFPEEETFATLIRRELGRLPLTRGCHTISPQ